jgi:hypothetical protein
MSRYDIHIIVFLANMNGPYTLLTESAQNTVMFGLAVGYSIIACGGFLAQDPHIMLKMASAEKTVASK